MEISTTPRNTLEIGFGMLYLIGAVFNAAYTNGQESNSLGTLPKAFRGLRPAGWHSFQSVLLAIQFGIWGMKGWGNN